jgi:hypothetical protein
MARGHHVVMGSPHKPFMITWWPRLSSRHP